MKRSISDADPRVLGQLLTAHSAFSIFSDKQRMAEFVQRTVEGVPGVLSCGLCLRSGERPRMGAADIGECDACANYRAEIGKRVSGKCPLSNRPDFRVFPLDTQEAQYGCLVLRLDNDKPFAPYEPFVGNLANSLALNAERRWQKQQLEDHARGLERKVEERTLALAESQRFLEKVVSTVPGIVYIVDLDERRIAYMSPQVESILGYERAHLEGAEIVALEQLAHPDDWPGQLESQPASCDLRDGEIRREGCRAKDASGDWHWLSTRKVVFERRDGRVRQILAMAIDVTEQRHTEDLLQRSQRLDGIGRLAGGIAHDFNNLLGVITGYGEFAQRQLPPEHPAQPRIEQILKAATRAAALTHQLLAFGRRQLMQPRTMDLNAVVVDLDQMLRRVLGEDIDLVVDTAPALGSVKADPTQLEQIIMNLVINARDAMPRGGHLRIETANAQLDEHYVASHPPARAGRYVMLAVSDTGAGMDAATQQKMFEPFFTTKPAGQGTGLGLATVYGIVKQSGGYIWVYSEQGRGTTFKVYLPRVDEPVEPPAEAVPPAASLRGDETLLVVEDTEDLRQIICEVLEDQGYTVLAAPNGERALAVAREHKGPIHLVLSDVVMPDLGGADLAKELTLTRPGIRVVFMSGYTNGVISQHGVTGKGVVLIEKPFTTERLTRAVREALSRAMPS